MEVANRSSRGRHRAGSREEVARLRVEVTELRHALAVKSHELEAKRFEACHDHLTGLLNRRAFYASAGELCARARDGLAVAMLLDLDRFKAVNDTLGHLAGDQVLVTIAGRLAAHAGEGWLLARVGGDELAGLRVDREEGCHWEAKAAALAEVLAAPMMVAGHEVGVRAAIGVTTAPWPVTVEELLGQADAAMYQAKSVGHPVVWEPTAEDATGQCASPYSSVGVRGVPSAHPAARGTPSVANPVSTPGRGTSAAGRVRAAAPVRTGQRAQGAYVDPFQGDAGSR